MLSPLFLIIVRRSTNLSISEGHKLSDHFWYEQPITQRKLSAVSRNIPTRCRIVPSSAARNIKLKDELSSQSSVIRSLFDHNCIVFQR